jgi:perosamine synthetase
MKIRIPLARPEITERDQEAVQEVLRTPYLSLGPKLQEFEQRICDYTGSPYAVAVNSGTSALTLAMGAFGMERGAEVILPSFTFSALLNVILQASLRPKFVDICPSSYNTTVDRITAAITDETRAVIAVHTFGIPIDMAALAAALEDRSSRRGWPVHLLEDASEALGVDVGGRKAGSLGEVGVLAFYPNKQITTGEGGILITSSGEIARKAMRLRNQGRDPALGWLDHVEVGFSYRLSEMNCALGISQLERIEAVIAKRQQLAEAYDGELRNVEAVIRPPLTSSVGRISWFVYPIRLTHEFSMHDRDAVCESMRRKGIASGRYFAPLHRQPVLRSSRDDRSNLPHTDAVAERIIALPFFNQLTRAEIHEVSGALTASIRELRRKT